MSKPETELAKEPQTLFAMPGNEKSEPTSQAVEQKETPAPDDSKLKFAEDKSGEVDNTPAEPVFKAHASDDEEQQALFGVSFDAMKNRNKETAEDATKEQPKAEDKVDAKTSGPDKRGPGRPPAVARDYTGIDEADVPLFKQMSNDSFTKMKAVYQEHRQFKDENTKLKAAKPETEHPSLYAHPEGYKLSSEYTTLSKVADLASEAEEHWGLQLARIRRGLGWQDIALDENNRIVKGQEQEPNEQGEVYVMRKLNLAQRAAIDNGNKLNQYIETFNSKQKQDVDTMTYIQQKYFPGYEKPDHPTAQAQKQLLDMIPEALRSSPLTQLLCIIGADNIRMRQQNIQLQGNKTVAEAVKNDAKSAPPPASAFKTGGGNGSTVSFSAMRNRHG